MIASLRARLLVLLLALSAVGLLVAGAVTYAEQRSFLLDRVDQQLHSAPRAAAGLLASQGIGAQPPPRGSDGRDRHPPGGRGGGGHDNPDLPPGTFAQRRSPTGAVIGSSSVPYYDGTVSAARPVLPARLRTGSDITVKATGSGVNRFRVHTAADLSGAGQIAVAIPLSEVDRTLDRLLVVEGLVIGGVLLVLGLVSWLLVRIGLRPLDRIGRTAGAIAAGDLSRRVDETDRRTEVGRLGLALNAMLDRLERAFSDQAASEDRLRRFLADASHELRTPLASIRGYAELFRMGAARSEADVAKAMRRIEDEAARMGVLVEDLLVLARLDEVAVAPHAPIDVAMLARDAVDDAAVTAPDRSISLRAAPSTVVGDAHQLRQLLANLLRNALVHTPAATPVEVTVGPDGHHVRVVVRDHGPGLPDHDGDALFERFWRAEGGRERGKGGAGLGLAIVAAIVERHGGRVRATDAEGGGARFVVELPRAPSR